MKDGLITDLQINSYGVIFVTICSLHFGSIASSFFEKGDFFQIHLL